MSENKRTTADAVEIIDRRFGGGEGWDREVAEESLKMNVGQLVHDLRVESGLSQKGLAARVGTSQSVISRVENADYEGSALQVLARVCMALRREISVGRTSAGARVTAR